MLGHHPKTGGAPEPRAAGDSAERGPPDVPQGGASAEPDPKEPRERGVPAEHAPKEPPTSSDPEEGKPKEAPKGGTLADLAERIGAFVRRRFPLAEERKLGPDDSLLDSGVVDSMGIWDIVAFFEEDLGLRLEDHDLVPENFDSIAALVRFARAKQS